MRVFVTGATGFIGSYVVNELLQQECEVVGLYRDENRIPQWKNADKLTMVQGDIAQIEAWRDALNGCDACVHIALGWGETPTTMAQNDTMASLKLMEFCAESGVEQFITTSSTAAMGQMRAIMDETVRNIPQDLYGATKAATEAYVLGFRNTAMRRNIVRPGYTFGNPVAPGARSQPDDRFKKIAQAALAGEDIELTKHDGTQFAWAGDLAQVYAKLVQGNFNEEIFLGLSNEWVSWQRIAQEIVELTGSRSKIKLIDLGWGVEPMLFGVDKIRTKLGLEYQAYPQLSEHIKWVIKNVPDA